MEKVYEPHKSSIGGLDANLAVVAMYVVTIILGYVFAYAGFLVPAAFFFLEKDSKLVKFNAAQCLCIQIASLVVTLLIFVLPILGILASIVLVVVSVLQLYSLWKAWNWTAFSIPVIGDFANSLVK